jgi:hypothetical protein
MKMSGLDTVHPHRIPENIRFARLVITGQNDPLPNAVAAFTHQSPVRIGLRLAGGCAGMSTREKEGMLNFFGAGLYQFTGLISSGATRMVDRRGHLDPMITDVPALLAAQSPRGVVAISTAPRTGQLGLVDDSRLVLSDDGSLLPNPGVHMLIIVQSNAGTPLDWDGDLDMYFDLFGNLVLYGGWTFGLVVYNGGGVTRSEALHAMHLGWPVLLIRGSGRQADALIEELERGTLESPGAISIIENGDWEALHNECVRHGLIVT